MLTRLWYLLKEEIYNMNKRNLDILKRCEVFLGLTDGELGKISDLPSCTVRTYKAGTTIFREGEEASTLHVLDEGRVMLTMRLSAGRGSREEVVDVVTKGGILSWSVLVAPYILTRSAKCIVPCKMLSIDGKEFRFFLDKEPYTGYEIMKGVVRVIASRLRDTQWLLAFGKRRVTL